MAEKSNTALSSLDTLRHTLQISMFIAIIVAVIFSEVIHATHEDKKIAVPKRDKRSVGQGVPNGEDIQDMVRQIYAGNQIDPDLIQYTPSTPSPGDVNCYVEVPVIRRVGGRCVPLGAHTMGCQAGIYLALSSECQNQSPTPNQGPGSGFRRRHPFRRRGGPFRRSRNAQ